MIPLPFLWKWLWVNFSPLDDKPASSEAEAEAGAESSSPPSSSGGNGGGGGVPKEVVVQELLSTKEVNKPDNVQASVFAKALIGRYLCVLFKDSVHCRTRFSDATNTSLYTVRRTSEAEHDIRLQEVPAFPQDLRVKILQELKEERLGRTSARNLLQLMTQPPPSSGTKKPRLETSVSTPHLTTRNVERLSPHSPSSSSSLSSSPSSPSSSSSSSGMSDSQRRSRDGMDLVEAAAAAAAVAPHPSTTTTTSTTAHSSGKQQLQGDHHTTTNRKRRRGSEEEDSAGEKKGQHQQESETDDNDEADESAAEKLRSMPEPSSSLSRRSSLKRSFSMSSAATAAAEASAISSGAENGRPAQRMRLGGETSGSINPKGTLAAEAPSPKGSLTGEGSSQQQHLGLAPMSGVAAMGRMLRRQVSTPVLPTQIRASPTAVGGGGGGGGGTSGATVQQEPWKREINDLWAKQLAMMREINTLKNELGRREAARQREILGLRQEIDGLRGEVFRIRQMKGLQAASSENLIAAHGAQKAEGGDQPAAALVTSAKASSNGAGMEQEQLPPPAATTPPSAETNAETPPSVAAPVMPPPPTSPTRRNSSAPPAVTAP